MSTYYYLSDPIKLELCRAHTLSERGGEGVGEEEGEREKEKREKEREGKRYAACVNATSLTKFLEEILPVLSYVHA